LWHELALQSPPSNRPVFAISSGKKDLGNNHKTCNDFSAGMAAAAGAEVGFVTMVLVHVAFMFDFSLVITTYTIDDKNDDLPLSS
jgi:hypothetical protein